MKVHEHCIWLEEGPGYIQWFVGRRDTHRPVRAGTCDNYDACMREAAAAFDYVELKGRG